MLVWDQQRQEGEQQELGEGEGEEEKAGEYYKIHNSSLSCPVVVLL